MKLENIIRIIAGSRLTDGTEEREVGRVCTSDLMSDVLTFGHEAGMLVTSLANRQTVRTAEMTEIPVVCYSNGKLPVPETIELAEANGIILLGSPLSTFKISGLLYEAGIKG